MSGRDSFAEIDRVKRELFGAQNDINRVLDEAQRRVGYSSPANYSSYSPSYPLPSYTTSSPMLSAVPTYTQPYYTAPSPSVVFPAVSYQRSISPSPILASPTHITPITIKSSPYNTATPIGSSTITSAPRILPAITTLAPRPLSPRSYPLSQQTFPSSSSLSNDSSLQEVIFNTIEDYMDKKSNFGSQTNREPIAKLLLPAEVNFLFTQQEAIKSDYKSNLEAEKQEVDSDKPRGAERHRWLPQRGDRHDGQNQRSLEPADRQSRGPLRGLLQHLRRSGERLPPEVHIAHPKVHAVDAARSRCATTTA